MDLYFAQRINEQWISEATNLSRSTLVNDEAKTVLLGASTQSLFRFGVRRDRGIASIERGAGDQCDGTVWGLGFWHRS